MAAAVALNELKRDSDMILPECDVVVPLDFGLTDAWKARSKKRVFPECITRAAKREKQPKPLEKSHATCRGLDLVVWAACMYRDSDDETVYRLMLEGVSRREVRGIILRVYREVTGNESTIFNSDLDPENFFRLEVREEDKRRISEYGEAHLGCVRGNHHLIPDLIYYRVEEGGVIAIFTEEGMDCAVRGGRSAKR